MTAGTEQGAARHPLRDWIPPVRTMMIGGAPVDGQGERWAVFNPATEQEIATVAGADLAQLDAAVADGTVRDDISAEDLLHALTQLSQPVPGRGPEHNQRTVAILVDGLRCGATQQSPAR